MTTTEVIYAKGKNSHLIKVVTAKDEFIIPVIDVRDGDAERENANKILKASRSSKFLRPSFGSGGNSYQVSHKRKLYESL